MPLFVTVWPNCGLRMSAVSFTTLQSQLTDHEKNVQAVPLAEATVTSASGTVGQAVEAGYMPLAHVTRRYPLGAAYGINNYSYAVA